MTTPIEQSLTLLAEKVGDPSDQIYAALFAKHPEFKDLFSMDLDGSVRGSMLQRAFECVFDLIGPRDFAPGFLYAERLHHDAYGVPKDTFFVFFETVAETVKSTLGPEWTPDMEKDWTALTSRLRDDLQDS